MNEMAEDRVQMTGDSSFNKESMRAVETGTGGRSSVYSSPSSGKLHRMIKFDLKHGNCGGSLVQFQQGDDPENALPFSVGKVLVSSDMTPDDVRGNHAHHETEEIVVALSGGCTFDLDDGRGRKETVSLSAKTEGRGRGTEDRGQRSEDGGQRTDDGGQRTEDGGQRTDDGGQRTDDGSRKAEDGSRKAEDGRLRTADGGLSSVISHQSSDIKEALLLYPHVWRTFHSFEPGTVLLVVANITYDEVDYIRDRDEFERFARQWRGLGGSADS